MLSVPEVRHPCTPKTPLSLVSLSVSLGLTSRCLAVEESRQPAEAARGRAVALLLRLPSIVAPSSIPTMYGELSPLCSLLSSSLNIAGETAATAEGCDQN